MRLLWGVLVFSAWNTAASGITLECVFQVSARQLYSCVNTNIDILENGIQIEDVSGVHEPDKSSDDVREIFFLSSAMRSLPQNVFEVFPYLSRYLVHGVDIQGKHLTKNSLIQGDFHGATNLNAIVMTGVNLHYLRADVFEGAENMGLLSLEACGITNIDENAFRHLSKLKTLQLSYNLVKKLPATVFHNLKHLNVLWFVGNNLETLEKKLFEGFKCLQKFSFQGNLLKVIDPEILDGLAKINSVHLWRNYCIDQGFGTGLPNPIADFKHFMTNCTGQDVPNTDYHRLLLENKFLKQDIEGESCQNKIFQ